MNVNISRLTPGKQARQLLSPPIHLPFIRRNLHESRKGLSMYPRHLLVAAYFVVTLIAHPALAQRDWKTHPAIVELTTSEDVYALGDVHGDYDRCADLLVACKILGKKPNDPDDPSQVQWTAKRAVLVRTGDMIDKGTQSVKVLMLMRSLQQAAKKEGGQFFITYGNHEAEFLSSPLDPIRRTSWGYTTCMETYFSGAKNGTSQTVQAG